MSNNAKKRYLIGNRSSLPDALNSADLSMFKDHLSENVQASLLVNDEVNLQSLSTLLEDLDGYSVLKTMKSDSHMIVEMLPEKVDELQKAFGQRLIIEPDEPLELFREALPHLELLGGLTIQDSEELTLSITVTSGDFNKPIANATVYAFGTMWLAKEVTKKNGKAQLKMYGETLSSIRRLVIIPQDSYWSFAEINPRFIDESYQVSLKPLQINTATEQLDWGHLEMGLDKVSNQFKGKNIKIAVIDSGLSNHEDVRAIEGVDFTEGATRDSWKNDIVGHGTHVTGTVAALHNGQGLTAFAPEAEIYICKVFPGGRISDLVKSLDFCIEKQIDIVNLSLGSSSRSEILEQKFREAVDTGVACFAAAGNSNGNVQFPAAFSDVFAVAAIGKLQTFPNDSSHSLQISSMQSGSLFRASFSCFGDEVDVCAPGVAITSTVASGDSNYAAWDGTSMACPHVVGFAALVLESSPELLALPRNRERVKALFEAIKHYSVDLGLDQKYQGAGLPTFRKINTENDSLEQILRLLKQSLDLLHNYQNDPN